MIKEKVSYMDVVRTEDGFDEIEKESIVRFLFSVAALKLYEQKTGRKFFKDYGKASSLLFSYITSNFSNKTDLNNLNQNEILKLAPLLVDPQINEFLFNLIPCLYVKIFDGKYIQNEETYEECENSIWLMELINMPFFMKVFQELSAFNSKKK